MMKAVIFACFDDFEIRLKYVKEALENVGYKVDIYMSDYDHYAKKYIKHKRENVNYIHVPSYKKNLSYARIHSHTVFAKSAYQTLLKTSYDLIYAIVPPNSMVEELAVYKKSHPDVKLIFEVDDLWPETFPSSLMKRVAFLPFAIWKNKRNGKLKYADRVICECDLFADILRKQTQRTNFSTVYLCHEQIVTKRESLSLDTLSFVYLGSMNHIIDIEGIVSFLIGVKEKKKVVLHLIGNGESKELFVSRLQESGITFVDHGVVYDAKKKEEILAQCHFGLNMMKKDVCVGLTMKSLDYFAYALPIINNIASDTTRLVKENKIGYNIDHALTNVLAMTQDEYNLLVQNTIKTHEALFLPKKIVAMLENIFRKM